MTKLWQSQRGERRALRLPRMAALGAFSEDSDARDVQSPLDSSTGGIQRE